MFRLMCRQQSWARSTSRKVPPWMTTTAWWPPTWWRPAEPCTCWSFAAACSAGGSGGLARLEAAWGTLELRDERRSSLAMGLSPYGCMRMVAELLLGHQTLWMLPRSISGVLGDSGGPCGPPWVKTWGHGGVWVFGPHTPRTRGGVVLHR